MASRVVSLARLPPLHGHLAVGPRLLRALSLGGGRGGLAAALDAGQFWSPSAGADRCVARPKPPHTFKLDAPWLSAMAQGQCSSLPTRLSLEMGSEELAASAVRGLRLCASLPTAAAWRRPSTVACSSRSIRRSPELRPQRRHLRRVGAYDVGVGLFDDDARSLFAAVIETLAGRSTAGTRATGRSTTSSRHRVRNIASPFYHALHERQLGALADMAAARAPVAVAERFGLRALTAESGPRARREYLQARAARRQRRGSRVITASPHIE